MEVPCYFNVALAVREMLGQIATECCRNHRIARSVNDEGRDVHRAQHVANIELKVVSHDLSNHCWCGGEALPARCEG